MLNHSSVFTSDCYGNLGEVFSAYIQSVRPHAHREPLRALLIGAAGEKIYEAPALTVLQQIQKRVDDGICYECETDLTGEIPVAVTIRATCSDYFWWHGREPRKFEECYDWEKGYFDLYPHINPFGTDFSRGIHMTTIVDRATGMVMQDKEGRNLAVYGYITWRRLVPAALEMYEKGIAFDFCEDGVPGHKLAHVGPKGCLRQNPTTGKWRAAWN